MHPKTNLSLAKKQITTYEERKEILITSTIIGNYGVVLKDTEEINRYAGSLLK